MTVMSTAVALRRPFALERRVAVGGVLVLLGIVDLVAFAQFAPAGHATFTLSLTGAAIHIPALRLTPRPVSTALGALSCVLGGIYAAVRLGTVTRRIVASLCLFAFVVSFLCWSDAGRIALPFEALLVTTVSSSIPLVLGALGGCLCERSGVINIAIEGQFLTGAFGAAVVASAFGSLWFGLLSGAACGVFIALLLGWFALQFQVDQVILGVVLNVFAAGLTGYLFDAALVPFQNTLNSPATFGFYKVPALGDIPIVGPVLFDSTVFLYITYVAIFLVQVGLFSTRWGLRVRSVGEHPTAADTVGIDVLATRWRNVLLGGVVAGIGGAYLTIGSVGSFGKTISSGLGFIALAALIFGRWKPLGACAAALLFGFMTALAGVLGTIGAPIPSDILLTFPYVATIVAVAGLVGRAQPPKADGQPYVKA